MGRLAVLALAAILALGGLGTAFFQLTGDGDPAQAETIELRKDDAGAAVEEEDDDAEGDGDRTRGNDGTRGGNNTGDGDRTRGDDGTDGGDNSYVAPAASAPAPAQAAPAASASGGGSYSG